MARTKKNNGDGGSPVSSFQHGGAARLNIPEATETQAGLSKGKKRVYRYSPHLSPKLQFDTTGNSDQVPAIIEKVLAGEKLTDNETEILRSIGQQNGQPWLEWAAKQEQQAKGSFSVDDVVLHIHERISAQAILATARRQDLTEQDFFARPKLHQEQALQYYRHSMDWANRLILGDSLQVMSSLARRENLAGKVQMIYFDPPYGIKFSSNWQNEVDEPTVKDKDVDVTREPEMIKAYRDTWTLGVHSYLAYLKQRFLIAYELLAGTGSIFVQISDENLHRVRGVLDEVFGAQNFCAQIVVEKTSSASSETLSGICDYILWYARDLTQAKKSYRQIFREKKLGMEGATQYVSAEIPDGTYEKRLSTKELDGSAPLGKEYRVFACDNLTSQRPLQGTDVREFVFRDKVFTPGKGTFKTDLNGLTRLGKANRLRPIGNSLMYKRVLEDFPVSPVANVWNDTKMTGFSDDKLYVVQTASKTIERCLLMTTEPGDLVLDPTCGSGTTAFVAEQWGRRWITIDSSRVAVSIARQRILTACFDSYKTKDPAAGVDPSAPQNPAFGFYYETVPHIKLKNIAQNQQLDPIFNKHEPIINAALANLNEALVKMGSQLPALSSKLIAKLKNKVIGEGARSLSDADLRRWILPGANVAAFDFGTASQRAKWIEAIPDKSGWKEWEVPFDKDPDWPEPLGEALKSFRVAWRNKMDEINAAIKASAEQEELVNEPEPINGVVRVSGPFSVEGVRPEELTLGEDGKLYDPTANEFDDAAGASNADSYIDLMLGLIRKDGVTFLGNRRAEFASLEKEAGKSFHARGRWKGKEDGADTVAVVFGPQYGPINAPMAVDAIESAKGLKEVTELVLAGFSFDSAAQEKAKSMDSAALRIHLAHIRPDVSPGMRGMLKETANSQLFTVFGQPDILVVPTEAGQVKVEMNGVCIYNPLTGAISESSSRKVAAWFLDTDYDGRCFCISQAFFPDKEAWVKISKALGSSVSEGTFEAFTTSWPFKPGKHNRIAVKVIDPRGNEVMAIQTLKS